MLRRKKSESPTVKIAVTKGGSGANSFGKVAETKEDKICFDEKKFVMGSPTWIRLFLRNNS